MNDFTKEELEDILSLIEDDLSRWSYKLPQRAYDLEIKVKSMIDNYCEHGSKIDIGEASMICIKCGKVTG